MSLVVRGNSFNHRLVAMCRSQSNSARPLDFEIRPKKSQSLNQSHHQLLYSTIDGHNGRQERCHGTPTSCGVMGDVRCGNVAISMASVSIPIQYFRFGSYQCIANLLLAVLVTGV